jgi:hypothetical protein
MKKQNKTKTESVVLNICERIGVRFPVDLSILVKSRIVACIVAGETRACHNLEIDCMPFPSCLILSPRKFHTVAVFFHLL